MQWIEFEKSAKQRSQEVLLDAVQVKPKNFAIPGHALIRGVAGSGKSLVLRDRIVQVLNQGYEKVLVLSYNRYMSQSHQWDEIVKHHDLNPDLKSRLECKTFHAWAHRVFGYRYEDDQNPSERQELIQLAQRSKLRYQAILVDEAQDFQDEWFQVLVEMLDPETNSLFFVYDNTQSVYGQAHRRKKSWTWKQLGIDVPGGRSQIFDLNYRNSPEIIESAWKFMLPSLVMEGIEPSPDDRQIGRIIQPKKKADRSSGISPLLVQCDRATMPAEIALQVKLAKEQDATAKIGILVHPKWLTNSQYILQSEIYRQLNELGIESIAPKTSQDRQGDIFKSGTVVIDSWKAAKGLEFDAVILVGIDAVVSSEISRDDFKEKAALYVAMTRAKDHLVMIYDRETDVVQQLRQAIESEEVLEVG